MFTIEIHLYKDTYLSVISLNKTVLFLKKIECDKQFYTLCIEKLTHS